MNADNISNVFGSIIVVAGITALVARGDKAAKVIGALSTGFADSISAALGKGVNFS